MRELWCKAVGDTHQTGIHGTGWAQEKIIFVFTLSYFHSVFEVQLFVFEITGVSPGGVSIKKQTPSFMCVGVSELVHYFTGRLDRRDLFWLMVQSLTNRVRLLLIDGGGKKLGQHSFPEDIRSLP